MASSIVITGYKDSCRCGIMKMTCEVLGLEYVFKVLESESGENKTPDTPLKVILFVSGVLKGYHQFEGFVTSPPPSKKRLLLIDWVGVRG
jgi:hypothetical protein